MKFMLAFRFVMFLVVHRSLHGHGGVGLIPDCQGIAASCANTNTFVDTAIGTAEAVEIAVRGNIAELNACGLGRVGAVIRDNLSAV